MEKELKHSNRKLQRSLEGAVRALASTTETRDPYTAGHQKRVSILACAIAKEMGIADDRIKGIRVAGFVHDVGKISLPAEVLSKPGKLTELEYSMIKTHPQVSYNILKTIEFPWPVAQIALEHHERMDGRGYPSGISGRNIILEARIIAVADVVEAMASHRPYRPARGIKQALQEISENKGILFDLSVVDACLKLFNEKEFKFK